VSRWIAWVVGRVAFPDGAVIVNNPGLAHTRRIFKALIFVPKRRFSDSCVFHLQLGLNLGEFCRFFAYENLGHMKTWGI
jgi:hypothetical protein